MIDCMKKYKMVLSSTDGEIVYKSDNVQVDRAQVYSIERNGQVTAEIEMTAWGMKVEEAETPPEMPSAEVAKKATKIIQEEKHKAAIEEQWINLTEMVCKAIKDGKSYITVKSLWMENEARLIEMGYEVSRIDLSQEWMIRWAAPFYLS